MRFFVFALDASNRGQQPDRENARSHGEHEGRADGDTSTVSACSDNDCAAVHAGPDGGRGTANGTAPASPHDARGATRFYSAGQLLSAQQ
jgi:hypothetical protein